MAERIILDPSEVATGRNQLDITDWVDVEGIDYGDAEISAYMADMERGSSPIDFRIPNRQIVIPLNIKQVQGSSITFAQARTLLQQKVARIQQEGGWIKRTTASGSLFADIVNATLKLGGDWFQANRNFDINAELRLEAIPDWYGAEVQLGDHVETSAYEIIWTETNIPGNYPGRIRLVVDDDSGAAQRGLIWGVRSRHYSASTTAKLAYDAIEMTPLDAATVSGPQVVHLNLSTNWTPILSTNLTTGAAALTHTGTYRVWGRIQAITPGPAIRVRFLWDVGDFLNPVENSPQEIVPGPHKLVDLGQVRLDRVPAGIHRWRGVLQAAGASGSEGMQVHRLWFQPVDEGAGVLRAVTDLGVGLSGYTARDEFNQSAGTLGGKALPAPAGSNWAGAGSGADFVVDSTNHWAQRTTINDSAPRLELAGATVLSNTAVSAVVQHSAAGNSTAVNGTGSGIVARFVDTNNYLAYRLYSIEAPSVKTEAIVYMMLGGSIVTLISKSLQTSIVGSPLAMLLTIDASGNLAAYQTYSGSWSLLGEVYRPELQAGGALDDGRVGLIDSWPSPNASTRYFDNFAAWVPSADAILFANRSAELRTEGMFRQDSTGAAYGPVTFVTGDLPRIPPSGTEGRTVQFLVKGSRGDFATLPDTVNDDISARVSYRPSYLFVN